MDTTVFGSGPEETALDAGDWDPTIGTVSLTDRLLSFANRIAERVSTKYPNVRLGLLAYVQFTRPPIKVRPHQNIVIELAPITYNRAHPMTDDRHPASADLRRVVEGWGEVTGGEFACYPYAYNLGEVSAPYPMIRKWSIDLPILFDHGCKYWQPETLPNFETSLPGLYLGLRLAWDPTLRPREVLEEFYDRFYGKSSSAMRLYWETMDNAWVDSEEFSGNGWGHLSRFPEEVLTAARAALDEALEIAESVAEYRRVRLAERSFSQLELLVAMRRDLNRGRFSHLKRDAERWAGGHMAMGREYSENYAFTTLPNTPWRSTAIRYFNRFSRPILESAGAIHESGTRLTATPIRRFRFQPDPTRTGLSSGWQTPDFNDRMWPTTDTGTETWSTLGLYDYMGTVWYRTPIPIRSKELSAAKPVFLWIAGADDELEVFVNGHHSPAVEPDGSRQPVLSGYARPASFDITAALKGSGPNMLAIRASRTFLNELGTGGLLGPAVVYQPK